MLGKSSAIRVGISSCLLGEYVRYNGEHKRDTYLSDHLSKFVEFVPICPEVGIGLGVPRRPIELRQFQSKEVRAVQCDDHSVDITDKLAGFGKMVATQMNSISGYVFKSKSPSCGVQDVKVHLADDRLADDCRTGVYAKEIISSHPLLPVGDEVDLRSLPVLCSFLERVCIYHEWQSLAKPVTSENLAEFHEKFRFNAESRSSEFAENLDRKVSNFSGDADAKEYFSMLMGGLMQVPSGEDYLGMLENICQRLFPKDLQLKDRT